MLNFTQLFVASAFAQDAAPAGADSGASAINIMSLAPFILIFLVFWVLVIRPQQKKADEQSKMIKALRRGDRVITSGGIYGKVTKLDGDDIVTVEIADGVAVKMARVHIAELEAKTDPAAPLASPVGLDSKN